MIRFILFAVTVFCGTFASFPTMAQGLSVIRDTESEHAFREWSEPVLNAAGLTADQVDLVLIDDSQVNAFVAGGANIFLYAGLIEKADFVDEVIGVIAHETGHVTGGHLIAGRRAMERASYQSILSAVLGVGAAILSGDGRAAGAISSGGSSLAQRDFFSHSRAQEAAADQAALTYFEQAGMSPEGLVTFMQKLEGEELLPASQQSAYMRTHPLTRERVEAMRRGLERSPHAGKPVPERKTRQFDRIKAKLIAFRNPQTVIRFYPDPEASEAALYAHAIMMYRQGRYDQALNLFGRLIDSYPGDPYYREMKAQTLRDSGRLGEAAAAYEAALERMDRPAPLVQTALAHVLIESRGDSARAEQLLLQALAADRRDARPYRLLATLKGRAGDERTAQYYLAEEAAALGNRDEARRLLALAMRDNGLSGDIALKARDLKTYLDGLPNGDN